MRISDWSSDVCSSDLGVRRRKERRGLAPSKLNLGQPKLNEGRQRRSASAQGESGKRGSSTHHPNGPERRKKETRDEEDADPLPRRPDVGRDAGRGNPRRGAARLLRQRRLFELLCRTRQRTPPLRSPLRQL